MYKYSLEGNMIGIYSVGLRCNQNNYYNTIFIYNKIWTLYKITLTFLPQSYYKELFL